MKPDRADKSQRIDPRAARSAAALRDAVLELAELQPIDSITVDQVVEVAHVTRKTFYNHVSNPTELLSRALTEELDQVRERMDQALHSRTEDLAALSRARLCEIIRHILARQQIYQQPDGRIHPRLYRLLSDHFYAAIRYSLDHSLRRIPRAPTDADNPAQVSDIADIYATYVAAAYAGAIDRWLPHVDTVPVDALLDVIINSLPQWMIRQPDDVHGEQL